MEESPTGWNWTLFARYDATEEDDMKTKEPEPQFVGVTREGEEVHDLNVLEEAQVAFDPTRMTLDLTKSEKRRTTALMLAIQAYQNLIIKDAEYLRVAHDRERAGGPVIQPATMDAMVSAAIDFDHFIAGRFELPVQEPQRANDKEPLPPKETSEEPQPQKK